jgi:2'-5' RNA ligase
MAYTQQNKRFNRPPQRNFNKPKRAPLPEGFSLFYIAVACPADVDEQIAGMKDYMFKEFGCRAAGKSPAHITIVPPFRAEDEMEANLRDFVNTFNIGVVPFSIQLKNYGQFADRVLFVDVALPNDSLLGLEKECMEEFSNAFPGIIFGMKPEFNPHVTIATRDIPEGALARARSYFETNHPVDMEFEAKQLTLFRLIAGKWEIAS